MGLKPGAQNSTIISHTGRDSGTWAIICCLWRCALARNGYGSRETTTQTRHCNMGRVGIPGGGLSTAPNAHPVFSNANTEDAACETTGGQATSFSFQSITSMKRGLIKNFSGFLFKGSYYQKLFPWTRKNRFLKYNRNMQIRLMYISQNPQCAWKKTKNPLNIQGLGLLKVQFPM